MSTQATAAAAEPTTARASHQGARPLPGGPEDGRHRRRLGEGPRGEAGAWSLEHVAARHATSHIESRRDEVTLEFLRGADEALLSVDPQTVRRAIAAALVRVVPDREADEGPGPGVAEGSMPSRPGVRRAHPHRTERVPRLADGRTPVESCPTVEAEDKADREDSRLHAQGVLRAPHAPRAGEARGGPAPKCARAGRRIRATRVPPRVRAVVAREPNLARYCRATASCSCRTRCRRRRPTRNFQNFLDQTSRTSTRPRSKEVDARRLRENVADAAVRARSNRFHSPSRRQLARDVCRSWPGREGLQASCGGRGARLVDGASSAGVPAAASAGAQNASRADA